ncbi:Uncharacterised protein [Mycobacterium tuberculosis]|nr:Uncharacterised protein [Mycobacterium tuberculosis]
MDIDHFLLGELIQLCYITQIWPQLPAIANRYLNRSICSFALVLGMVQLFPNQVAAYLVEGIGILFPLFGSLTLVPVVYYLRVVKDRNGRIGRDVFHHPWYGLPVQH